MKVFSKLVNHIKTHPYKLWYLYPVLYIVLFSIVEVIIGNDYPCYASYIPLDDKIPFFAPAVFAYILWHPLLFLVGIYLSIKDPEPFHRYMLFLSIGFTASLVTFLLFPNAQYLRPAPEDIPDGLAKTILTTIYSHDTYTNVLPSMHVIGSGAIMYACFDSKKLKYWIVPMLILNIAITAATVLCKQHSILDVFVALGYIALLCAGVEIYKRKSGYSRRKRYGSEFD